jgi:hypothetical protein
MDMVRKVLRLKAQSTLNLTPPHEKAKISEETCNVQKNVDNLQREIRDEIRVMMQEVRSID